MKTKIEKYLEFKGFHKLYANIPDISVYVSIENSYINAFVMADADGCPGVTRALLNDFLDQSDWKAPNGEDIDVHALSVIFSEDEEKAREVGADQTFCWYVNTAEERLVIDSGKCEDFYGMKRILTEAISATEESIAVTNAVQEPVNPPAKQAEKGKTYVNYGLLIANFVLFLLCIFNGEFFYKEGTFDLVYIINERD